jgi:hypothetical protein
MNTEILSDYKEISPTKVREFPLYLEAPDKSPRIRFRRLLNYIKKRDQGSLFKFFLEEYRRLEHTLDGLRNSPRSRENRKKSLKCSVSLRHALELDVRGIPSANDTPSISQHLGRLANDLVREWKDYARCVLNEAFEFSFRSTDLQPVDALPENLCVVFDCQPQTGLFPLLQVCDLEHPQNYVASIVKWNNNEPFLLSEKPVRYLRQGDVYVRFLPVFGDLPRYFILSNNRNTITTVLGQRFTGLLLRGGTYRELYVDVANPLPDMVVYCAVAVVV